MYMIRVLIFLLSTPLLLQAQISAKWMENRVTVDGQLTEWKTPFNLYDSESKLAYSISNNDSTLFIAIQAYDGMTQLKILRAGIEVNLINKGKNKRKAEILFPIINDDEKALQINTQSELDALKRTFIFNHLTMETEDFVTQNGTQSIVNSKGIQVAMNWDAEEVLNYELAIPFSEICDKGCSYKDLQKSITLKVNVNGLDRPKGEGRKDDTSMSGSGRMANDDRMNPGGNMPMGGNQMGMPGQGAGVIRASENQKYDEKYERQSLKIKEVGS